MTPPVRGWRRAAVAATLVASGTSTGTAAGLAAGALWAAGGLPALPVTATGLLVLAALLADAALVRGHGPAPLAVRRQVPAVWSSLFAPGTVALLYGGRLGVGALTVLPSWTWWVVVVAGASLGPAGSAAAGGVFGAARGLAMVGAGEAVRRDGVRRTGLLEAAEPAARRAVAGAALAACVLAIL